MTPVPVFPVALAAPDAAVPAKRFLGMQLRRPRKDGVAGEVAEQSFDGPAAPVAAWPTDVGLSVVADAEPALPLWAPPLAYAPADSVPDAPADAPPDQAAFAGTPLPQAPFAQAPAQEPAAMGAALDHAAAVVAPVAGPHPFAYPQPPAALPIEVSTAPAPLQVPVAVPVVPAPGPVAETPVPQPADDEELRAVRMLLEASEARRLAAEQRADQAVAYGQQMQAELARLSADLEGRLAAAEVRARTVANESQDWQIRHREAAAQVAELAASVGGAEQRLSELRVERDELLAALEEATSPDRSSVAEQLAEG